MVKTADTALDGSLTTLVCPYPTFKRRGGMNLSLARSFVLSEQMRASDRV